MNLSIVDHVKGKLLQYTLDKCYSVFFSEQFYGEPGSQKGKLSLYINCKAASNSTKSK